jgi:heme-degrading monooxygenase HmoA
VELFRTAPGYVRTVLLRDLSHHNRYLTIDTWEDEPAYRRFRQASAAEFEALDRRCESLTVAEREVGRFEVASTLREIAGESSRLLDHQA